MTDAVDTSTFRDMLNQASQIVQQSYRGARVYEATLNVTMPGSPWLFVFNDPDTVPNSTVMLNNYMGQFQLPPQHVDSYWGEDRVVPLPIPLDLSEAVQLAKQAGYGANISNYTLRWPLAPGVNEPHYILAMPSLSLWVFVGVYTKKIATQPFDV
jgi:hypothetical protein